MPTPRIPCVLDISHHNDVVSWPALKEAGIFGIIHKATEGSGLVDTTYAPRRRQAESAGLRWGAYHFNSGADPKAQADHFLSVAKPDANTLLALDWEDNQRTGTMTPQQARIWLERVMQVTGRPPAGIVIYGGNVLKERITKKDDIAFFGQFPLWLCQYGPTARVPKAWKSYWLWQYSEHGKISGMASDGNVDLNVHGGVDLAAEWAGCTVPDPIRAVEPAPLVIPAADPPSDPVPAVPPGKMKVAATSKTVWAIGTSIMAGVVSHVHAASQWVAGVVTSTVQALPDISSDANDQVSAVKDLASTVGATDAIAGALAVIGIALALYALWRHVDLKHGTLQKQ